MEKSELIPIMCAHIVDETTPCVGLPDENNNPAFYCPACTVQRVAELVLTLKPAAVYRMMYVEPQHATAITHAMQNFTFKLRQTNPERSLVRNRTQCVARYIYNAAGLGHSLQSRFRRYNVPDADWRPRRIGIPCEIEKKSLSSFSGVEVFNRVVTEVTA